MHAIQLQSLQNRLKDHDSVEVRIEKKEIGITLPLLNLDAKEIEESICAVSLLQRIRSHSNLQQKCVCVCLLVRTCLFVQHFPCASRSFTPINLFRYHFAHIMYLAVFNLFTLCWILLFSILRFYSKASLFASCIRCGSTFVMSRTWAEYFFLSFNRQ